MRCGRKNRNRIENGYRACEGRTGHLAKNDESVFMLLAEGRRYLEGACR
ncbi:hypothetical protein MMALV_10450 [Candidatus Methanomethylophilus alvi Mx1201]|jgi:hypothetical protein|uniref:Uncharacterized protein n=1 Tax=Methanomethylophilus alvi (strain Mx1201) TaxID=1236689 RepID=M9SEF1_METAX|nr:hypothetical protein [Methanomethylophilus alvi]CDF30463.1 unknown [Methanoculleus sp. CAG:1088]AGI85780.1 hypothetical protein MMALV_10450 [Candidatus Methanomethylophilus alvi Mx1201]MCI5974160.1 hypothetical protein [Methanomethylophilus alvi]MDD7480882.1 hypothetical protein [Methanomethylophilus alvi]MDY7061119.1 hypothetical protein [Methanomethylophilus alvi]